VITKTDLGECNVKRSRNLLIYAGINPKHIYVVSSYSGEGIAELEAAIHHFMDPHRNK
jgi:ethanolamine utilization protein EutP